MAAKIKNNTLYRFRSMDSLLGEKYNELELQSIYFSPPEFLNDPMEGFRLIHFQGDSVLWENLFNNYLACLVNTVYNYVMFGETESIYDLIPIYSPEEVIPDGFDDSWVEIKEAFLSAQRVRKIISNIVSYRPKVYQDELSFYLASLHGFALKSIFEVLGKKNVVSRKLYESMLIGKEIINDDFFKALEAIDGEQKDSKLEFLIHQYQLYAQSIPLVIEYNNGKEEPNKRLLANTFPYIYTKKLEQIMYPNWFTACFMSKATNSSVWGNYGHNHSGACLIFNCEIDKDGHHSLQLNNMNIGYDESGVVKGKKTLRFYKVNYNHRQESINFFDSIGQLPIPLFNKQWAVNKDGIRSQYISSFNDEWREKYWEAFYTAVTQKISDWEYENEYRLILNNMSGGYKKTETLFHYDFTSLKGIIFGINTTFENKLKVVKIIEEKVRENGHYDFKFYQAYYCKDTGEIKHDELNMLKFKR